MKRICVYCGSSSGSLPDYTDAAKELGAKLASNNIELVYGGACVGIMGAVANAVLDAGGRATGVIPKSLEGEVAHSGLSELHVVDSMHARKALMFELSCAFIAMPGGFGTLEEILEVLTWGQLGFHSKPCALLNTSGYFDKLIEFLEYAGSQEFIRPEHLQMLLADDSPKSLLDKINQYQAPTIKKWWRK